MERRVVSVWLPRLATDRLCRTRPAWRSAKLITANSGTTRQVMAANGPAQTHGLRPGMPLAQAMALAPDAVVAPHDPDTDRRLLDVLAERCGLYSPWTATEGACGLWLDVAGCGHLFGGETDLLDQLSGKLKSLGLTNRAALAPTPGAAWAWARFGDPAAPILEEMDQLAPLPLAALRLSPRMVGDLAALGLRRIGELLDLPRPQVSLRFGRDVLWRLDQALGVEPEPISSIRPVAPHRVHMAFVEPMSRVEDIAEALRRLLAELCNRLIQDGLGARRLDFTLFRVDGTLCRVEIGTGAPSHDPGHLFRLFRDRLADIRPGFGIEAVRLDAVATQAQTAEQSDLDGPAGGGDLPHLLDSLSNRLGPRRLMRLLPHPSHIPERCVRRRPPGAPTTVGEWPAGRYPIRLLAHPDPIDAMAPIPDAPPLRFRWQGRLHQVVRADGPERIAPEWWHEDAEERDYYRVEDTQGLRFWLYRQGHYGQPEPPRWYLHGVFP
ncbi:Y-family DNA polymerase [Paramagnetospirillum kuznetsovii]|nr:DNA polymerase Y family protein [Paramagnetospirillum kuznetsovii]